MSNANLLEPTIHSLTDDQLLNQIRCTDLVNDPVIASLCARLEEAHDELTQLQDELQQT
jgi:hypothetical protein